MSTDMEAFGATQQPLPAQAAGQGIPIWDLVIADMKARDEVGRRRYGTRLLPHNGRVALVDAYQEALDMAVYLRQELLERAEQQIDTIFLDLDGVLVDFTGGAIKAHECKHNCIIPGEFYVHKGMGITEKMFWSKCQGHDFWANLEWMHDGKQILDAVMRLGVPVWLLSTHSDDAGSCSGKYDWVSREIPHLRRNLILCPNKAAVSRPGALLIDDYDANIEKWIFPHDYDSLGGGQAILVPRLWNSFHRYHEHTLDYVVSQARDAVSRGRPNPTTCSPKEGE